MLRLSIIALSLSVSSCALVTTPVKIVGKAATTTIGVAGKAAGAGINAITPGKAQRSEED